MKIHKYMHMWKNVALSIVDPGICKYVISVIVFQQSVFLPMSLEMCTLIWWLPESWLTHTTDSMTYSTDG